MKTRILINVDYEDPHGRFWCESLLKNAVVEIETRKSIHQQIARLCEERDDQHFSYKARPCNNVYIDLPGGAAKAIGYVYRTQSQLSLDAGKSKKVAFRAWVTLQQVSDFPIREIQRDKTGD